jgi:ABC-type branched-subunit amino acid transport system substrate-binding protein
VVAALVAALVAAGCTANSTGSSKSTGSTASTSPGATTTQVAGTGPGVTATTIKLGVAMINWQCIPKAFVDEERPKEQAAYQAFIDDINEHGGISGRKIVPVYKKICPLAQTDGLAACTSFSDDSNVFAVIGEFGQITGDVPLCVTKQHSRPLVTYGLTQDMIDKAPPGMLLTPDILPDRRVKVIVSLLKSQHTLDGKTVAILADSDATARVDQVIVPALRGMGVKQGSTGVVTISGTDTTNAQGQLDSFIEKWKTQHVDALVLAGPGVESKQFVEKVRATFPSMTIVADSTGILTGAQDEQKAHVSPNPYTGMITAEGLTGVQHSQTPNGKMCTAIFEKHTGIKVPSPLVVIKLPDGRQNNIYGESGDACALVTMFKLIAERVGKNLNIANWTAAVDNFGPINVPSTNFASLHAGKYDADDTYGLVAYDPTIGDAGDWKQLTPVKNVSGT